MIEKQSFNFIHLDSCLDLERYAEQNWAWAKVASDAPIFNLWAHQTKLSLKFNLKDTNNY
jgi:hypothetical protein